MHEPSVLSAARQNPNKEGIFLLRFGKQFQFDDSAIKKSTTSQRRQPRKKKINKKVNPSGADGWGSSDTPDISSPIQYSMGRFKCRLASNLITLDACHRRFKICPISPSSHVGEKEKEKVTSVVRWPEAYVFYLYYFFFPPPDWQKERNQWGMWNQSWSSKSTRSMSQPSHCTQRTLMYLSFSLKTKKNSCWLMKRWQCVFNARSQISQCAAAAATAVPLWKPL